MRPSSEGAHHTSARVAIDRPASDEPTEHSVDAAENIAVSVVPQGSSTVPRAEIEMASKELSVQTKYVTKRPTANGTSTDRQSASAMLITAIIAILSSPWDTTKAFGGATW